MQATSEKSQSKTLGALVEEISSLFEAQDENLFYGHGTDNPWDEAVFLVLTLMNLPPDSDRSIVDLEIPAEIENQIQQIAHQRIKSKKPLPYLLQCAYFAGLKFYVDERVLIPRSSFGELILNQFSPWLADKIPEKILEIGTGSGCMAIATALVFENAHIFASDISTEALEVAKKNIAQYGLEERITLIKSDLFDSIPQDLKFDLIMSNPPYVDQEDMENLPSEYLHEPKLALESGRDGLYHTRKIIEKASDYLTPEGSLFVEVGNSYQALEEAFPQTPFTWISFEHGECEIFTLDYNHLRTLKNLSH
jgi:ribosomal protein L3 glutamine methyltransferase